MGLQELAGVKLFIRDLRSVPKAITVDLDKKLAAKTGSRPWCCQVSVTLSKPSADGLAEDSAEIETLGVLADLMLERIKPCDAEWVAMATVGGERSWFVYAADVTDFDALVRTAFSDQSRYIPRVVFRNDPAWTTYFSLLPNKDEENELRFSAAIEKEILRTTTMTMAVVQLLKRKGDKLEPRPIDFTVFFKTAEAMERFAIRIERQFSIDSRSGPKPSKYGEIYTLQFSKIESPSPAQVLAIERHLVPIVLQCGGRYDGWGTFGQRPGST